MASKRKQKSNRKKSTAKQKATTQKWKASDFERFARSIQPSWVSDAVTSTSPREDDSKAAGSARAAEGLRMAKRQSRPSAPARKTPPPAARQSRPNAEVDEDALTRKYTSISSDSLEMVLGKNKNQGRWMPIAAGLIVAGLIVYGVNARLNSGTVADPVPVAEETDTAAVEAVEETNATEVAAAEGVTPEAATEADAEEAAAEAAAAEAAAAEAAAAEAAAAEAAAAEAAAAEAAAAEALAAVEPEPPTMVTVSVSTIPASAELRMDGAAVANPYSVEVEQAERSLRFAATAAGYQSAEQILRLSESRSVVIRLEEVPPPPRPVAVTPRVEPTPMASAPAMAAPAAMRARARTRPATPRASPMRSRPRRSRSSSTFQSDNPY